MRASLCAKRSALTGRATGKEQMETVNGFEMKWIQKSSPNRRTFLTSGIAAVSASAWAQQPSDGGAADLIIENASIWTQDPMRPIAKSVAIRDGLIISVSDTANMSPSLKGSDTRILNAAGKRMIPGLNDSHMHPTRGGRFYSAELRWDGVKSLREALDRVALAAKRTPPGQWVRVVGGWSPFQFQEKRLPTPAELTQAAPDTPVFVLFLYSRGFLNRAGVQELDITPNTRAAPMTRYEFTEDGGAILHAEPNPDLLYGTIGSLPALNASQQISSTMHFYRDLNRFGITSVIDAGGGGHRFPDDYSATADVARRGDLSLRVSSYLFPQDKGNELSEFQRWTTDVKTGADLLHGTMHGYIVRGGGEFLAWAAGDYENFLWDAPDITTRNSWRPQLLAVTRLLLQERWPLRIHATYDESINHILDVFEEAHLLEVSEGRAGFSGIRWAIDHAETAKLKTLKRIKSLGGGIAVQSRMAYAGEYFKERYGAVTTSNAPRMSEMVRLGIPLGLGSDSTRVSSYNPWNTLYWATTGKSIGGEQLLGPQARLSRVQSLFAHSVGSAWFSQEERLKGRIRVGQFADLSLLNHDFLSVPDEEIRDIESTLTVTSGKVVYGAEEFAELAPTLPEIEPSWSPVRLFGGYANCQSSNLTMPC